MQFDCETLPNFIMPKPVYGFGWRSNGDLINEPKSLRLKISFKSSKYLYGQIEDPANEFHGWWAALHVRGVGFGVVNFNVLLGREKPNIETMNVPGAFPHQVTGFASLEIPKSKSDNSSV